MRDDERIQAYVRSVRSSLHVSRERRRRILEEIEHHLVDGAAAHMDRGATRDEAIASVIDELGPPGAVAAAFDDSSAPAPVRAGAVRWLPMLLPLLLFVPAVGLLAWSLTWVADGLTVGEKVAQRADFLSTLVAGTLSAAAYVSIRRAHRDHGWRWAAWLCTGCALVMFLAPWTR